MPDKKQKEKIEPNTKQYFQQAPCSVSFESGESSLVMSGSNADEVWVLLNFLVNCPAIEKCLGFEQGTSNEKLNKAVG